MLTRQRNVFTKQLFWGMESLKLVFRIEKPISHRNFTEMFEKNLKLTKNWRQHTTQLAERFNHTLTSMLRKEFKHGEHFNWEDMLGDVFFSNRSSVHSSTLDTSFFQLHGRDPNILMNSYMLPKKHLNQLRIMSVTWPTDYDVFFNEPTRKAKKHELANENKITNVQTKNCTI